MEERRSRWWSVALVALACVGCTHRRVVHQESPAPGTDLGQAAAPSRAPSPDDRAQDGAVRQATRSEEALSDAIWADDAVAVRNVVAASPDLVRGVRFDRRTALGHAASSGKLAATQALLEAGAPVDARDTSGDTALIAALNHAHDDVARAILARNPDPAAEEPGLALTLAAREGLDDILAALITRGPAPIRGDARYQRALAVACKYDRILAVKRLLAAGLDVDFPDPDDHGYTPLITAAQEGKAKTVALLLRRGATVDARDTDGQTALYWAVFAHRPNEIPEYREMGEPHDTYFEPPGDPVTVRVLLDGGAAIGARDTEGNTPLHEAVLLGATTAARLLVQRGASATVKNTAGDTPRSIAIARQDPEMIKIVAGKRN
jgi:uncharacterized protein